MEEINANYLTRKGARRRRKSSFGARSREYLSASSSRCMGESGLFYSFCIKQIPTQVLCVAVAFRITSRHSASTASRTPSALQLMSPSASTLASSRVFTMSVWMKRILWGCQRLVQLLSPVRGCSTSNSCTQTPRARCSRPRAKFSASIRDQRLG